MQTSFHTKIKYALGLALALISLCISNTANAQITSDKGWFEVDYNAGCNPLTITITNTGLNNSTLFIDFYGDPDDPYSTDGFSTTIAPGQSTSNQYTTPGKFLIRVVDTSTQSNDPEDRIDILEVDIISPAPIDFETYLCTQNSVNVKITNGNQDYDYFEIDFGDGSPPVQTTTGTSVVSSDYTYANQGTYTITVTGGFNNGNSANCATPVTETITTLESIATPQIESVVVIDETSIEVTHRGLDPNVYYELVLLRNVGDIITVKLGTGNSSALTTTLVDFPFLNTTTDFYEIFLLGAPFCSPTYQVQSNSVHSIIFNLGTTSVDQQFNTEMEWATSTQNFSGAELLYGDNRALIQPLNTAQGTETISFDDCAYLSPIYIEKIENGAISRSITLTPFNNQAITLPAPEAATAEYTGNAIDLAFPTPNFPFTAIEIFEKQPDGSFNSIGTSNTLYFTDTDISGGYSEVCYTYTYTDECGNISTTSSETCVELEGTLRIPNAFSPNGDNQNDTFTVGNGIFIDFQMLIFNRWGELVFQGNDPTTGWNGTFNSKPAPIGAYVYRISYNRDGIPTTAKGTVTLIR
ncbi:gliding motility-associated C-terminal domain-containing protein [Roseivirga pacifica]|uniref:T9SS type B sorting domain-containing protein n=1 Tax=Roseivirga pacifica TaxID=1267423 RepID=UPI002096184A|nr:gliding motility-associated C-terminal domain-containing protein [Roseivirga pacifica]MCO6358019.1 T9SS type B sorting domain-containing protein [Roseivirga pacifica]MCO6366457.1 T9SS type B sorting domain-containing protein [Roseivirga pacifica]MCO6370942.1 T9SS type B sorting domain-containing protein [Roseivirga pacifica]MCO6373750.1 T9SS type B sorting domain-containing protein [Roseivirga pacifica]MCO6380731.1 T9SS type B sorting domain-containing protein [Roseivirga pacifica]